MSQSEEVPEQISPQAPLPDQLDETPAKDESVVQTVHLPSLISDEFGHTRSSIRMQIALGTTEIDGEQWNGDGFDLPYEEIVGKTITVKGPDRTYRVNYRG